MNDFLIDWIRRDYLPAFASTVAIELGIAILLGCWHRRELLAVVAVNLLTHPALHLVLWLAYLTDMTPLAWPALFGLEVAVFLAEWRLLAWRLQLPPARAALLSFAMNAASALLGLWLPQSG